MPMVRSHMHAATFFFSCHGSVSYAPIFFCRSVPVTDASESTGRSMQHFILCQSKMRPGHKWEWIWLVIYLKLREVNRYIMTLTDCYTKWAEALPIGDKLRQLHLWLVFSTQ